MTASGSERHDEFLLGFSRADWLASGALSQAALAHLDAGMARGEAVSVTHEGWLQLARWSPALARDVWARVGPDWVRDLRRSETDDSSGYPVSQRRRVRRAIERRSAQQRAAVDELRRLAGAEQP